MRGVTGISSQSELANSTFLLEEVYKFQSPCQFRC